MQRHTLSFTDSVQGMPKAAILDAALETSGYISKKNTQEIQLDGIRRLYLLLADPSKLQDSTYAYRMTTMVAMNVCQQIYTLCPELERPFEHIGYKWGWLPQIRSNGTYTIDTIQPLPIRDILGDPTLPAYTSIATCTLSKHTTVQLPPSDTPLLPYTKVFIDG